VQITNVQMKSALFFFSFIFLVGCDPIYHLNYIVENQSRDTLLVTGAPENCDTVITYAILPSKSDTIFKASGVGYSKPVFDEQKDWLRKGIAFYSSPPKEDSAKNWDSFQFIPSGTWNYSEKNRCEGKAILVITADDLKK